MVALNVTDYKTFRAIGNELAVVELSITEVRLTREVKKKLSAFKNLEKLVFTRCRIQGTALARVATLPKLRALHVLRSTIVLQDATQREDLTWRTALDHLHTIPGLCELDLTRTDFIFPRRAAGTRDFDFLSKMGALTTLTLDGTHFDDACIPKLLPLKKLRRLSLRNTRVGAKAAMLNRSMRLQELNLKGTPAESSSVLPLAQQDANE